MIYFARDSIDFLPCVIIAKMTFLNKLKTPININVARVISRHVIQPAAENLRIRDEKKSRCSLGATSIVLKFQCKYSVDILSLSFCTRGTDRKLIQR